MRGVFFYGIGGLGGGNEISLFQQWVPWPRTIMSELSLVVYVYMSKYVTILLLRKDQRHAPAAVYSR